MNDLSEIESILDSYCTDKIARASQIDNRYVQHWQEIHHYLMSGGKRLRPRLVMLAYGAYKKSDDKNILHVAATWELLHACLLVHDDIIDRDLTRHGQPNIAGRYQTIYGEGHDHYALSAALLGGDLLLMSTYEMINSAPISSDDKLLAQSFINKALFTVAGGELIDTDAVLYPIKDTDPISVATHKTASYSLQLPLQCGAALAGASDDELDKLAAIGLHTGVAYQLRDDLLGVFGDSDITGKSNRSDIAEKKRTMLIHKTLENGTDGQASRISELYSPEHTLTNDETEEIVQIILESGAKKAVEAIIDEESGKALGIIKSLKADEAHKTELSKIISKLATRTS